MRTFVPKLALTFFGLCLLLTPPTVAQSPQSGVQDQPQTQDGAPQGPKLDQTAIAALDRLATQIQDKRKARDAADAERDYIAAETLEGEIQELRWQFARLATHMNVREFEQPSKAKFDLQTELQEAVQPLISFLKEATAAPRRVTNLQSKLTEVESRRQVAVDARSQAAQTLAALKIAVPDSPATQEAKRELDQYWDPLLNHLGSEILVINENLRRLRTSETSWLSSVTNSTQLFLSKSGLNIVLSILVFLAAYFGLRFISDWIIHRHFVHGFSARLLAVVLRIVVIIIAITATLIVPYARNDWLLLTIGIIFLVGAGWVIIKTAPQFFEQIRLVLNVGAVREGERILIDGLPYRVETLRFYSKLVNPDLQGGILRIPVRDLIDKTSRPADSAEPWFLCKQGDVVSLTDGLTGQVQLQTPEVVVVTERNGAPRNYPTMSFLQLNPRNLSQGFEIEILFGIDYAHQSDVTSTVPEALASAIKSGFSKTPDADTLIDVTVELGAAGSSSLELQVLIEFKGAAAPRYHSIHRKANQLLVTACTDQGFGIPFPQLQVHGIEHA